MNWLIHRHVNNEQCVLLDLPMLQQPPYDHLGRNRESCATNDESRARLPDPRMDVELLTTFRCLFLAQQCRAGFQL